MRHMFRAALLSVFVSVLLALPTSAQNLERSNAEPEKVAIQGYDTVAYFTDGRPTKGKNEFAFSWNDAKWLFASARHRDLFAAKPERYAPQFKGFCAGSLTRGKIRVTDPEAWMIIEGKLYLARSQKFVRKFQQNTTENLKKAEEAWAKSKQ